MQCPKPQPGWIVTLRSWLEPKTELTLKQLSHPDNPSRAHFLIIWTSHRYLDMLKNSHLRKAPSNFHYSPETTLFFFKYSYTNFFNESLPMSHFLSSYSLLNTFSPGFHPSHHGNPSLAKNHQWSPCVQIQWIFFIPHLNLSATSGSDDYFVILRGCSSLVLGIPQIFAIVFLPCDNLFWLLISQLLYYIYTLNYIYSINIKIHWDLFLKLSFSHSTFFSQGFTSTSKKAITVCIPKFIFSSQFALSSLYSH